MYGIVFLRDISFFQVKEIIYEQNLQTCLEQSKKHLGGDFRNRQRTREGLLVGKQEEKAETCGHGGFFGRVLCLHRRVGRVRGTSDRDEFHCGRNGRDCYR